MSDLATAGHLRQSTTQFPVSWYCDPRVLEAEQRLLFARGPGYVGPRADGARTRATTTCSPRAATRRCSSATRAASSSCPTSAATARRSCSTAAATRATSCARSTAGPTTCKGELLGAPHFPDKPCLNLGRTPLQNWNGLLFDGPRDVARDLAALGVRELRLLGLRARPRRDAPRATTTGRRSSRSTSRTTTSARSTRASASSSRATT